MPFLSDRRVEQMGKKRRSLGVRRRLIGKTKQRDAVGIEPLSNPHRIARHNRERNMANQRSQPVEIRREHRLVANMPLALSANVSDNKESRDGCHLHRLKPPYYCPRRQRSPSPFAGTSRPSRRVCPAARDTAIRQAALETLAALRAHLATLLIAGATLPAAGILAKVALHMTD